MTASDHARPWLSAAADGMLIAGQGALMIASVILALLIFVQAAERAGDWQFGIQTEQADPTSCEGAIFGP